MIASNDISFLSINENGEMVGTSKSGLKRIEGISFLERNSHNLVLDYLLDGPVENLCVEFSKRIFWNCSSI